MDGQDGMWTRIALSISGWRGSRSLEKGVKHSLADDSNCVDLNQGFLHSLNDHQDGIHKLPDLQDNTLWQAKLMR